MDDPAPGEWLPAVQPLIDRLVTGSKMNADVRFGPDASKALASMLEKMARKLDGTYDG